MRSLRTLGWLVALAGFLTLCSCAAEPTHDAAAAERSAASTELASLVDEYIEQTFEVFPSRALSAGRADHDQRLELLDAAQRQSWLDYNREALDRLSALDSDLDSAQAAATLEALDDRIDAYLLRRQIERVIFDFAERRLPERSPQFWSGRLTGAVTFLLVRTTRPEAERFAGVVARLEQIPALADQAERALAETAAEELAPVSLARAARQLEASADFYEVDLLTAYGGEDEALRTRIVAAGGEAGAKLRGLAEVWRARSEQVTGSQILGPERYARLFKVVNGIDSSPHEILAEAEQALLDKKAETAQYGRSVWSVVMADSGPEALVEIPADDTELVRQLFQKVGSVHASDVDEFVADYKARLVEVEEFVRTRGIITLPDPLTVTTDRSPEFFSGQGVGGVYPAGPYAPEEQTLFYLPTPSDSMTEEQTAAFFRDFNHPFNVMITPHEMIPGHYLQLKVAARHPRKIRSLFSDGVYTEGWGTFCERLLLDQGWGDELARLAHLKKQMENIARTIVDIRVHSLGMERDEVLDFVQNEALQDAHFASNMWTRAVNTAPQITSYWLGYREHMALFEQFSQEDDFDLRNYMDRMVSLGSAPLWSYRELLTASR